MNRVEKIDNNMKQINMMAKIEGKE